MYVENEYNRLLVQIVVIYLVENKPQSIETEPLANALKVFWKMASNLH